jgi:glutaredoxin
MSQQLPTIVVYGKDYCPYCRAAKQFFADNNYPFTYFEVSADDAKYQEMLDLTGGAPKTVPQIIINGQVVGGYDNLMALVNDDKLTDLLNKID